MEAAAGIAACVRGALAREAYRPERHYMRGPGPKARAMSTDTRAAAMREE